MHRPATGAADNTVRIGRTNPADSLWNATQVTNVIIGGRYTGGSFKGESLESITAFTSGFAGAGYKIIETGSASTLEVDNLTVRKKMDIYELAIHKISSVNVGIMVDVFLLIN